MGAFIYVYACGGRARGRGVYLEGEDTPLGGDTFGGGQLWAAGEG